MYPSYKPQSGGDPQFITQTKDLQILLYLLGLTQLYAPKNEADDVIATIAQRELYNIIYTVDKDLMQLVTKNTHLFNDKDKTTYTESLVEKRFKVKPTRIPDLLAIMGDKADNIPGLAGYGPKKTVKALQRFDMIELIPSTDELHKHKEKLLLYKRLTQLNKNCTLTPVIEKTKISINDIIKNYELNKIKEQLPTYKQMGKRNTILDYL